MNSEDEDFNDIYGDEPVAETKNDSNTTAPAATKESSEDKQEQPTSSLDQLAALQALSSNLNNLATPNSNSNNNTSTDLNNTTNNTQSTESEAAAVSTATGASDASASMAGGSTTTSGNVAAPGGLPWEQLRQTMSQLQQPADSSRPVKADLSKDSCKMFIGGLNWETTEETLRDYFNKYGKVVELKIMKDNNTGRSRGFGFLTFEDATSVDEVVKTQHILDGKVIDPKRAIPREEQDKTGKIFVGGIGADVRPKEFEDFFAQYGTIIDAQLMLDKDTGRSRGFGFVTYDSPDAVDRVCQNKFIEFKGKQIEIKRAEPRTNQKPTQQQAPQQMMQNMNPMMYQNPMMSGFNPMYNQQAMTDYYQQMQQYYQQMQQQTGVDYTQMFQQQMSMMMPGMGNMAGASGAGAGTGSASNSNTGTPQDTNNGGASGNVQTIGGESSESKDEEKGSDSSINLPKGPRGPASPANDYERSNDRGDRSDRSDRNDRDYYRGSNNGHRRRDHRSSSGGFRGGRGGSRRKHGYHPYNR
ncbi:hypothetical protein Kpol_1076p11 [Vanderwaltozyma polyspora DSM 70294]|uniref:RRM domain-containing protein n=1 Tax=Vanderwaltozyma polyspora (strain ATCC 22028 / DSM 70294 / BCRC 21397 / CBS 2163 / NBRC 10782 / NRRL Y-8283 / UCD 57-17) TaxID=436907 RepID=A7TSG2_VANPO|nr:uncharacterized protein Kpol_1076p11 [Vanderwaltozyma polyspora DSM 70294]EDO14805.1 hypothetical protein Kpol_1076p11 [Vanderwaltozyma polyspora DSM 70294]